jgi:hypothetical protein
MVQLFDTKVEGFNSSGQSTRVESWPSSAISRIGSLSVPVSSPDSVPAAASANSIHPVLSQPNRMLVTDSALIAASTTPAASASAVWKMTDLPASTGSSSLPLPAHPHHHPRHLHPVGASGKQKKTSQRISDIDWYLFEPKKKCLVPPVKQDMITNAIRTKEFKDFVLKI